MDWYHMLTWAVEALVSILLRQQLLIEMVAEIAGTPPFEGSETTWFLFQRPPKADTAAVNLIKSLLPQPLDLSPLE